MLSKITKTTNMSTMSVIENSGGTYDAILNMVGSIGEDGKLSATLAVNNPSLYEENMEQVDADFIEFKNEVLKVAQTYK